MKYYLHDTSAIEDEKVNELFIEFGYEGVGLFYVLLEKIAKQEKPIKTKVLKSQLKVGKKLEKCWSFMESIGLIHSNNGETFNKQLLNFSEKYQIKKEKNKERVSQWRENQTNKENVTHYESVRNNAKVKESKIKENKVKESKDTENINVLLPAQEILIFLNETANRSFDFKNKNSYSDISARLKEGYTLDELKEIIQLKTMEWINDDKMRQYLTPSTLFSAKNCNKYKEQVIQAKINPQQFKNSIYGKQSTPKTNYPDNSTPYGDI